MTTASPLPTVLLTLTDALVSSLSSLPPPSAVQQSPSSLSLLSTKNELFLAYLQHLTFLIILNLRAHPAHESAPAPPAKPSNGENKSNGNSNLGLTKRREKEPTQPRKDNGEGNSAPVSREAVVENLIGLRVYLEKGVRPLEARLKYQLDKLLLAAADHARESASNHPKSPNKSRDRLADDGNESSTSADAPSSDDDYDNEPSPPASSIPPLAHRPNPSALMKPSSTSLVKSTTTKSTSSTAPYRPPHVNPTAPPTASGSKRAPRRSRAVDAFIREEMGDAPVAEMSIGAGRRGVAEGGRQAEREREKKEWEETKLVRLPGEKKRRRATGDEITAGMDWGLEDDERGGGEERERKRKKKGKSKSSGGGAVGGKRRGRK